jgi:hypothetical protein
VVTPGELPRATIATMPPKKPQEPADDEAKPRGNPVSLYPLTPEQAIRGMFQIAPADVARIVASKPEKKAKGRKK